jgi:hypothetical protein
MRRVPIAKINPDRRLLAVPVNWRHLAPCGAWTFDRRTFGHYRRQFDLVHFHLRGVDGADLIYATAADMIENSGHSSWRCDDKDQARPERLHLEKTYMHYDREAEEAMPRPEPAQQGSLLI